MTRWDAVVEICARLRAGLLDGERAPHAVLPWELLIEVASFHLVTPALAKCLEADPKVPADVREYFAAVAALNAQRNERMLVALARAAGLLNAIGIEPVMLKGAALLLDETHPEASLRILGDVDVLIPASRADDAFAALTAAGFRTLSNDVVLPPGHHHLPMLHDEDEHIGLELHTDVIATSGEAVIATDWFCERLRPARLRGHRVLLPEPTRNVGHVIFHSEIFHANYWSDKVHLRHLLDLAMIRSRHENEIDWHELDRRFSAGGFGEILATYLAFAEALFGQPTPKLSHAPRKDALDGLRSTESRNSFHAQIERLAAECNTLRSTLNQTIAARDRLQDEAARATAALDQLAATQAHTMAERDAQARGRHELEQERARILASRSWRWTKPLRALVAASRRWRR